MEIHLGKYTNTIQMNPAQEDLVKQLRQRMPQSVAFWGQPVCLEREFPPGVALQITCLLSPTFLDPFSVKSP